MSGKPEPDEEAFGVKGGNHLWRLILEAFQRAAESKDDQPG